jgi:L-ribulose-5-phosphate 3-epimerase UlaE
MTEEELSKINDNMKDKIGEESFAMILDDIGTIMTGREVMEQSIKERDDTIADLKSKNEKLVAANAQLFKQIPVGHTSKETEEEESPTKNISLKDCFDANGNFKH